MQSGKGTHVAVVANGQGQVMDSAHTKTRRHPVRPIVLLIALLAVVLLFGFRLIDLQIVHAGEISRVSNEKRSVRRVIYAHRGKILDRKGIVLAESVDRYDITISPVNVRDFVRLDSSNNYVRVGVREAISQIAHIVGADASILQRTLDAAIAKDKNSKFAYLYRAVPFEQYAAIKRLRIPWVYSNVNNGRLYPNGSVASNLLGFVGSDGTALAGIERMYDSCLAGHNGVESWQRSQDGVELPGSYQIEKPVSSGKDVHLTLDADAQWRMQEILASGIKRLGGTYGFIGVSEAKTGNLIALADYPTLDSNFPTQTDAKDRGSRAFGWPFEPGSIIKPITAAALYDAGVLKTEDIENIPDKWNKDGAKFEDYKRHTTASMNINGVLVTSSNVGIATFASRLPARERYEYLKKFGFGESRKMAFEGESPGYLPLWKDWDKQTNYVSTFGYGFTTNVAQILSAYSAIANSGVRQPLRLFEGCKAPNAGANIGANRESNTGENTGTSTVANTGANTGASLDTGSTEKIDANQKANAPRKVVSSKAAERVLEGLEATALRSWISDRVRIGGYRVGVKTGTAELVDRHTGKYITDANFVSTVGIAPIDNPKYIVFVAISAPKGGAISGVVAPLWKEAMEYMLRSGRVPMSKDRASQIVVVK